MVRATARRGITHHGTRDGIAAHGERSSGAALASALLLVVALPARPRSPRRPRLRAPRRPHAPEPGAAAAEEPTALGVNPAGIGFVGGLALQYFHEGSRSEHAAGDGALPRRPVRPAGGRLRAGVAPPRRGRRCRATGARSSPWPSPTAGPSRSASAWHLGPRLRRRAGAGAELGRRAHRPAAPALSLARLGAGQRRPAGRDAAAGPLRPGRPRPALVERPAHALRRPAGRRRPRTGFRTTRGAAGRRGGAARRHPARAGS